ncbi:hypothetical protein BE08_09310 [Sorangium cellulosum]|uniref:Uncharacterized protein n=1 Tax=Sorangium cellulosum TaxID=56 RepID=A0A150PGF5_SORCE|nr:hypothetical protein BE08_09310 [Sorangium cellulosum]
MISVAVKVETECGTCRLPMPVNTLAREVSCASCGRPAALADDLWKALLRHPIHDGPTMLLKEGRSTSASKLSAAYTRRAPSCQGCDKEIPIEDIREVREQAALTCERCAKRTWVRAVPVELAGALPGITHLVGEDPDPAAMASEGAAEAATFPCPQCGSPVPFDGVTRACVCRFCNASVHVPDDFVFRGRRKVAASWFLCFHPSIADGAPAAEAVSAGLFDWEDPPHAAVDAEGNLYCAARQLRRTPTGIPKHHSIVWSMDPSMNVRWLQRGRPKADRLVLSPESKLLVTSRDRLAWAWLASTSGTPVEEGAGVLAQASDDELRDYQDLACDRDGSLLVLKGDILRRLSSSGLHIPVWTDGAARHARPVESLGGLRRISCGADGTLYCLYGSEIVRVDIRGRVIDRVQLSSGTPDCQYHALGVDLGGSVYILGDERLVRISAAGEQHVILESKRDRLPRSKMSLAVCPEGAFWLFGTEGLAWKFDPGGALLFDSGKKPRPKEPPRSDFSLGWGSTVVSKKARALEEERRRADEKRRELKIKKDMLVGNIFLLCLGLVMVAIFALVVSLRVC